LKGRWECNNLFFGLLEEIEELIRGRLGRGIDNEGVLNPRSMNLGQLINNESMVLFLTSILARIWYDFDSLPCTRIRPFKSPQRLMRDVRRLSLDAVKLSCDVIGKRQEGDTDEQQTLLLTEFISRANII